VKLAREIRASLGRYNLLQLPHVQEARPDWEDEAWDALSTAREKLEELMYAEISAREARDLLAAKEEA
jgi:hypothetical protein